MRLTGSSTVYYVEHDGDEYRTSDGKFWERGFPESWESEYIEADALTTAFSDLHVMDKSPDTPLTDEALEEAGYRKFLWNGGAFWEWWKPIYRTWEGNAFDKRICVRFNEFPDSIKTYLVCNSMFVARGVKSIEELEALRVLIDGE